ncbi:MAG TPA: PecA family PE domain-processing aspartic protease [Mycobacterium sp.]|uniref:PecA family PE domain-processing aspartic protease n=1 Tax=Mycobacterium sp. TaxID=1785 RepID=UPI002F3EA0D8
MSAFAAAAAMATGSAAPASADFDALIDPIIQPILTSLTDSLAVFDPAAALDLTSWTDSFLASLNAIDLALPSTADSAAAVAAAAEPAAATGPFDLPLSMELGTEPAVNASIASGPDVPLLVDTGSTGLVIPYTDLGDNWFTQLEGLFQLGFPNSFGESGYSGGVEYIYATYNNVPVDYDGGLSTNGPVDVELLSWPTSSGSPLSFQEFLADNQVSGILGIGDNTAGPADASPFESYGGVLVDIPEGKLIVDATNPLPSFATVDGAPVSALYESVNGGTPIAVINDIDSGGVWGTIPSSLASSVPAGTTIEVYNGAGGPLLYSYTVGDDFGAPAPVSGTDIDSGVAPYLLYPIYIDYANGNLYFDNLS